MYFSVKKVKVLDNFQLLLYFEDGSEKVFDMKPYLDVGKFSELKDINLFKRVTVNFDTIEWPNGLDIDPEFLYEKSYEKEKTLI